MISIFKCVNLPNAILTNASQILNEDGVQVQTTRNCENGESLDSVVDSCSKKFDQELNGTFLFLGGTAGEHFHHGHTLLETLARWWILDLPNQIPKLTGIVVGNLFPVKDSFSNQCLVLNSARLIDSLQRDDCPRNGLEWIATYLLPFIDKCGFEGLPLFWARSNTKIETLIVPDQTLKHLSPLHSDVYDIMHPIYSQFGDWWLQHHKNKELYDRIYISRGKDMVKRKKDIQWWKSCIAKKQSPNRCAAWRICDNEDQVEDVLTEFGVKTLYFEDICISRQICLSRAAKVIVGLPGSNSHNAILANSSCLLIQLPDMLRQGVMLAQELCNKISKVTVHYSDVKLLNFDRVIWSYSMDAQDLREKLREVL